MKRIKSKKKELAKKISKMEHERVETVKRMIMLEELIKSFCDEESTSLSKEDLDELFHPCSICFQHGVPVILKPLCKDRCTLNTSMCLICARTIYKLNPDQVGASRYIKCMICREENEYPKVPLECINIDWQNINFFDFFLRKSKENFLTCGKCGKSIKTYKQYLEHLNTDCPLEHTMCNKHCQIYIRTLGCPMCPLDDEEKKNVEE